jgi:nucleoside-diphosphate-sugar epimerase
MAILVTGGAGFVGLNVVHALLERGDEVVLFDSGDLPPGAERALRRWQRALMIERGSVLDAAAVASVLERRPIDRVIHAAAITSGPVREARQPAEIVEVNLAGTLNVLDAARRHRVKRFVYVGSGAAYGESLYRLPRLYESTPSVPTTLYSITKHAAERTCLRLSELWGIDVVCVRLGTVIGPWERNTGARDNYGTHTQLAGRAVAGKTAILPSEPVQRDWVYAPDVAKALSLLVHAPAHAHAVYNVSSGAAWGDPIPRWCEALARKYPRFEHRTASTEEAANIWYTDRDRGLMDIGRLVIETGFASHTMEAAYAAYLEWIVSTPEFFPH